MKIRNACRLNGFIVIISSTDVRIIMFIHIIINYRDQEANKWTHDCYQLTVTMEIDGRLAEVRLGEWLHLNYIHRHFHYRWQDVSLLQRGDVILLLSCCHSSAARNSTPSCQRNLASIHSPQIHFTPSKLSFTNTQVCTSQIYSSACWVLKRSNQDGLNPG